MEQQIREIVAAYTKVPATSITAATAIDRSAVASSIIIHRMYARLAAEGIVVQDYAAIKTFGELMQRVAGEKSTAASVPEDANANDNNGIGIDMEEVAALPEANDFRSHTFYTENFAAAEIAYCILQPASRSSFAGLFAAKEAIVKADNRYRNLPFNQMIIDHLPGGKPSFPGFNISISHTGTHAIAVAVKTEAMGNRPALSPLTGAASSATAAWFSFAALLMALLTLVLFFFKTC